MPKIKIENTEVFKQVAEVIGKKQARIELFKASKTWDEEDLQDVKGGCDLVKAFMWHLSEQREKFWIDINSGVNPYEK